MRRISGLLKDKAISSLRRATAAFNGVDDDGRQTTVLLHLQHCFEMLLKAALLEKGVAVFDRRKGRAIGFEKCLNLSGQHLRLVEAEVGILRAIDALRDDEQRWTQPGNPALGSGSDSMLGYWIASLEQIRSDHPPSWGAWWIRANAPS